MAVVDLASNLQGQVWDRQLLSVMQVIHLGSLELDEVNWQVGKGQSGLLAGLVKLIVNDDDVWQRGESVAVVLQVW